MAAILVGAAAAAPLPRIPVDSRAEAQEQLRAAIADEQRVIELIKKEPPRIETARQRIDSSTSRLNGVVDYLSEVPGAGAAEDGAMNARGLDHGAYLLISAPGGPSDLGKRRAIEFLERAILNKRGALRLLPDERPPAASAQCSDGKDNDGDGIVDWTLEPGCSSARDVRERSPFGCSVGARVASGRLALEGSCSGTFSEVEFTLLDGLQLNGRFDIKHAPSCSPPTVTRVRCKTKNGAQNPGRLVDVRFTTTARQPGQRVQLRFFDIWKRQIARFFVPVR